MKRDEQLKARIEFLDQSIARIRAERSRVLARASLTERKRDTRQKILIGSAVLLAVLHEGVPPLRSLEELLAWLEPRLTRPYDRTAFDFKAPGAR